MNYISKNNNYRVILRSGLPGEPMTGRAAVSGLYVKFVDGIANITDEETNKLMKDHPGFGTDFVEIEDDGKDPWGKVRKESEPQHNIMNIEHGAVGKSLNPVKKPLFTPAQLEAIEELTTKKALEMAPKLAKKIIDNIDSQKPDTQEEVIDHKVTEDDLDNNQELKEHVEVGDVIGLPTEDSINEKVLDDNVKPTTLKDKVIKKDKKVKQ